MSYLVIARKWRPQTFEEVVGQSHATKTLQNAITAGRVAHSYLFTGPRGVGKTSTARILAKALNCAKGPTAHPCLQCDACKEVAGAGSVDVIEIDGASNNSVDHIRDLRERVHYSGVRDRYKVYIIDEVHMLTAQAFNALLKTLEEPPAHVIFIFATTEAQKVPATILSRTQRFDFRRNSSAEIVGQLRKILVAEGLDATDEALALVARAAGGSMRDAQTVLDQVISFALGGDEKRALLAEDVLQVLGGVQESQALAALRSALRGDSPAALLWLHQQYGRGADLKQVLETLQELLRGLLLLKASPQSGHETELLAETQDSLKSLAPEIGLSRIFSALKAAGDAESQLRFSNNARLALEMLLLKLAPAPATASLGELVDELNALEQRLAKGDTGTGSGGTPAPAARPAGIAADPAPLDAGVVLSGSEPSPQEAESAGEPVPVVSALEDAAPSALTLERVRNEWDRVVQLASAASLRLGSALSGLQLNGLEGGLLSIQVANGMQHKILEESAQQKHLQTALQQAFGRAVAVKVLLAPSGARPGAGPARTTAPSAEEVAQAFEASPQLKKLTQLFGGEIVEIRKQ